MGQDSDYSDLDQNYVPESQRLSDLDRKGNKRKRSQSELPIQKSHVETATGKCNKKIDSPGSE